MACRTALPGRLVWQDAGWRSPRGQVPLGSYAMDVRQAAGEALQGQVITLSGPLQANGTLQLQARHYAVDILLASEAALDAQLQQMLSLIAVAGGCGLSHQREGRLLGIGIDLLTAAAPSGARVTYNFQP